MRTLVFVRGVAATFDVALPALSDASPVPTLTLYDADGTELLSAVEMTRDTTATTLAEYASEGQARVRVASASGIVTGREYLVGDTATEQPELRRVLLVQGTILGLGGGFFRPHASGAAVVSTRVTYPLTSGLFTEPVRYGKARISYEVSDAPQTYDVQFVVVEHALVTVDRLLAIADAALLTRLSEGVDIEAVIALARDALDMDIGRKFLPYLQRGIGPAYEVAHLYKTLYLLASPDRPEHMALYKTDYAEALAAVLAQVTIDFNDDNAVSPDEAQAYAARTWARN